MVAPPTEEEWKLFRATAGGGERAGRAELEYFLKRLRAYVDRQLREIRLRAAGVAIACAKDVVCAAKHRGRTQTETLQNWKEMRDGLVEGGVEKWWRTQPAKAIAVATILTTSTSGSFVESGSSAGSSTGTWSTGGTGRSRPFDGNSGAMSIPIPFGLDVGSIAKDAPRLRGGAPCLFGGSCEGCNRVGRNSFFYRDYNYEANLHFEKHVSVEMKNTTGITGGTAPEGQTWVTVKQGLRLLFLGGRTMKTVAGASGAISPRPKDGVDDLLVRFPWRTYGVHEVADVLWKVIDCTYGAGFQFSGGEGGAVENSTCGARGGCWRAPPEEQCHVRGGDYGLTAMQALLHLYGKIQWTAGWREEKVGCVFTCLDDRGAVSKGWTGHRNMLLRFYPHEQGGFNTDANDEAINIGEKRHEDTTATGTDWLQTPYWISRALMREGQRGRVLEDPEKETTDWRTIPFNHRRTRKAGELLGAAVRSPLSAEEVAALFASLREHLPKILVRGRGATASGSETATPLQTELGKFAKQLVESLLEKSNVVLCPELLRAYFTSVVQDAQLSSVDAMRPAPSLDGAKAAVGLLDRLETQVRRTKEYGERLAAIHKWQMADWSGGEDVSSRGKQDTAADPPASTEGPTQGQTGSLHYLQIEHEQSELGLKEALTQGTLVRLREVWFRANSRGREVSWRWHVAKVTEPYVGKQRPARVKKLFAAPVSSSVSGVVIPAEVAGEEIHACAAPSLLGENGNPRDPPVRGILLLNPPAKSCYIDIEPVEEVVAGHQRGSAAAVSASPAVAAPEGANTLAAAAGKGEPVSPARYRPKTPPASTLYGEALLSLGLGMKPVGIDQRALFGGENSNRPGDVGENENAGGDGKKSVTIPLFLWKLSVQAVTVFMDAAAASSWGKKEHRTTSERASTATDVRGLDESDAFLQWAWVAQRSLRLVRELGKHRHASVVWPEIDYLHQGRMQRLLKADIAERVLPKLQGLGDLFRRRIAEGGKRREPAAAAGLAAVTALMREVVQLLLDAGGADLKLLQRLTTLAVGDVVADPQSDFFFRLLHARPEQPKPTRFEESSRFVDGVTLWLQATIVGELLPKQLKLLLDAAEMESFGPDEKLVDQILFLVFYTSVQNADRRVRGEIDDRAAMQAEPATADGGRLALVTTLLETVVSLQARVSGVARKGNFLSDNQLRIVFFLLRAVKFGARNYGSPVVPVSELLLQHIAQLATMENDPRSADVQFWRGVQPADPWLYKKESAELYKKESASPRKTTFAEILHLILCEHFLPLYVFPGPLHAAAAAASTNWPAVANLALDALQVLRTKGLLVTEPLREHSEWRQARVEVGHVLRLLSSYKIDRVVVEEQKAGGENSAASRSADSKVCALVSLKEGGPPQVANAAAGDRLHGTASVNLKLADVLLYWFERALAGKRVLLSGGLHAGFARVLDGSEHARDMGYQQASGPPG
eukprot:g20332.t1